MIHFSAIWSFQVNMRIHIKKPLHSVFLSEKGCDITSITHLACSLKLARLFIASYTATVSLTASISVLFVGSRFGVRIKIPQWSQLQSLKNQEVDSALNLFVHFIVFFICIGWNKLNFFTWLFSSVHGTWQQYYLLNNSNNVSARKHANVNI